MVRPKSKPAARNEGRFMVVDYRLQVKNSTLNLSKNLTRRRERSLCIINLGSCSLSDDWKYLIIVIA